MIMIHIKSLKLYREASSGHDGWDGTEIHFEKAGTDFFFRGWVRIETDQEDREILPNLSLKDAYDKLKKMTITL